MVVTDIQACFVVGACIADLSAPALASAPEAQSFGGGDVYARSRHRAFLYPALFLGPSATLFMLSYFGLFEQMHDFARGMVDTRAVTFYVSLTFFFLFLTLRVVESRRWK